jgi:hypothetical protein
MRLVLVGASRLTIIGMGVGLSLAFAMSRVVATVLFGVNHNRSTDLRRRAATRYAYRDGRGRDSSAAGCECGSLAGPQGGMKLIVEQFVLTIRVTPWPEE